MKIRLITGILAAVLLAPNIGYAQDSSISQDSTTFESLQEALQQLRDEIDELRRENAAKDNASNVSPPAAPPQPPSPPSPLEVELESLFEELGEELDAAGFHLAIELNQLAESLEFAADSMRIDIRRDVNKAGNALEELEIILENRATEAPKYPAAEQLPTEPKAPAYPEVKTKVRIGTEGAKKDQYSNKRIDGSDRDLSEGQWVGLSYHRILPVHFSGGTTSADLQTGTPAGYEFLETEGGGSWKWELNPFEYRARLVGDYLGVTTGIGFDWTRIQVAEGVRLNWQNDSLTATNTEGLEYKKHRIDATHLRLPILLSYRSDKEREKAFHIEAGAVFGLNILSGYRREYVENDVETAEFTPGFQVRPIHLNYRLTVGYGALSFIGEIPVFPFFSGNNTPEMYLPSFGLMLHL
jgi:hypothetical protein